MSLNNTPDHYGGFKKSPQCGTQTRVARAKPTAEKTAKPRPQKPRPRPALLRPLGQHLRRLRLERALTQEKLGASAKVGYKYIGTIEHGQADPGADVLARLAKALSVPVGELFATITPTDSTSHRLSPADAEDLATALAELTTVVNRIIAGQPSVLPLRAPRQAGKPRKRPH
jgi:transcriptional regulator with XRE-family HTH domain